MSHRFEKAGRGWPGVLLSAWVFVIVVACGQASTDPTGGETHFLRVCEPEGNSCGESLSCVCGICTKSCEQDTTCRSFPRSQCTQARANRCGGGEQMVCDSFCGSDEECAAVSEQHSCVGGVCRLELDDSSEPVCDEEEVGANELIVIGDSFFAMSHQLTAYLEELARSAGALDAGERYRDLSRLLDNALAQAGRGLQTQYETAASEAPAKVVIMNGGGADVLLGSCEELTPECPLIVDAAAALEELLLQMADDGVQHVVFVGYPDPQPEAVFERMDVLRPLLEERCESSPVPCHWVDLRPVFEGHYDDYIDSGGLNPTAAGSEASAEAIWAVMERNCIAQ